MPREVDVNQFRRGDLSQQDIKQFVEKLDDLKAKLLASVAAMKEKRLSSIYVDGIKKIPHGTETVAHGIRNIEKAIIDATWAR